MPVTVVGEYKYKGGPRPKPIRGDLNLRGDLKFKGGAMTLQDTMQGPPKYIPSNQMPIKGKSPKKFTFSHATYFQNIPTYYTHEAIKRMNYIPAYCALNHPGLNFLLSI